MTAIYEIVGPTRTQVVDILIKKYKTEYEKLEEANIKLILEEMIPENKTDFGSWRGWSTFGLEKELVSKIENKLELENEKIS
jgi:hypothetical protein